MNQQNFLEDTSVELVVSDVGREEEVETIEKGLVAKVSSDELYKAIEEIEKKIEAFGKLRKAILKVALPGDWVVFKKDDDSEGVCELSFGGANRIKTYVGIGFENWVSRKVEGKDEKGEWYRWEYECDAVMNVGGKKIVERCYGRCGSRDKFFGKVGDEWKPLSDINEGDIKIAAKRAAEKDGVKSLLGLHKIPESILKEIGVKTTEVKGWTFKSKPTEEKRVTEKQIAFLMSIANNKKVSDEVIKEEIKKRFNKESKKDLNHKEFDEIIKWLQGQKN